MSVPECMEIYDDDDAKDEDSIYECDFDINEVVTKTLLNLDVKAQLQDAINTTYSQLDIIARKYHLTAQVFTGLDEQIKKLQSLPNALKGQSAKYPPTFRQSFSSPVNKRIFGYPSIPTPASQKKLQDGSQGDALDVIPVARVVSKPPTLPPNGPLVRKDVRVGNRVYALKGSAYGVWYKARIIEVKPGLGETQYKVKFDSKKMINVTMTGKQLAYHEPADVLLPVGTRVIAQYRDEYWAQTNSMYAGIVAEPPKVMNNYRYLIFFDDGYAQYVTHGETRVVCEVSKEVWEDIHPDSKDFIKNYLKQYPERPMVKLQTGHILKTEWNGKWWIARVMEVDASLVKMYFHADKRTEWIYRGSTRLGPLYCELANAEAIRLSGKGSRRHNILMSKRKSAPYVEYTRGLDDLTAIPDLEDEKRQVARKHTSQAIRPNVARKSTAAPASPPKPFLAKPVEVDGGIKVRRFDPPFKCKRYVRHDCSSNCLGNINSDPIQHKGENPLIIPMLLGWERHIVRHKHISKRVVFYRAPCGRRLRTMNEVYGYLRITKSLLTIDLFSTDSYVHVFNQFVPHKVLTHVNDITYGKENVVVSGVNSISMEYPAYVEYSTRRIPNKGVNLNLDAEFLLGCDCEDNCSDPTQCSCQKLTQEAARAVPEGVHGHPGYVHRRLKEQVITGIYECNHNCKCGSTCVNRVVQNGLTLRLQVFKTEKRGWGIRCLDDVCHGGFICIYAGQMLTEQGANQDGTQFGDEYLAELDHIEVVECMKEGYESDVVEPESEGNEGQQNGQKSESEAEDDGKDASKADSDGNWEDGKQEGDSSDSDFEANLGPIAPRVHETRFKDKRQTRKTVNRRLASDQDSSQSWNQGDENTSVDVAKPRKRKKRKDKTNEPANTKGQEEDVSEMSEGSDSHGAKSKEKKKEGTSNDDKEDGLVAIESESEDENSKTSKTSSDLAGGRDSGTASSRLQSRFWSMPDPRKLDKPTSEPSSGQSVKKTKYPNTRSLFGEEFCYVMDAKSMGNIGRYLNHNCSPNTFVQNVFVDTHDLRFPWVAFFALQYIRAGSELTWDYHYEVGSVPDKVLHCYCGASNCRGRLL